MKRLHFAAITCLFVTLLTQVAMADDVPSPRAESFAGKVLLVYLDRKTFVPSHALANVTVQEVEGRRFLVGTGADTLRPNDWKKGLRFAVRWQRVTGFVTFTPDDFEKFCKEANTTNKGGGQLPPVE